MKTIPEAGRKGFIAGGTTPHLFDERPTLGIVHHHDHTDLLFPHPVSSQDVSLPKNVPARKDQEPRLCRALMDDKDRAAHHYIPPIDHRIGY